MKRKFNVVRDSNGIALYMDDPATGRRYYRGEFITAGTVFYKLAVKQCHDWSLFDHTIPDYGTLELNIRVAGEVKE